MNDAVAGGVVVRLDPEIVLGHSAAEEISAERPQCVPATDARANKIARRANKKGKAWHMTRNVHTVNVKHVQTLDLRTC